MTTPPRDPAARVLESFGNALIRDHVVSGPGLERALAHSRASGLPLQDALVTLGLLDEQTAYRLLATAADLPFADLHTIEPSLLARHLVPVTLVHRHEVLPLDVDDRKVRYATATPGDSEADRAVSMSTGRPTVPMLTCRSDLRAALAHGSAEPPESAARAGSETRTSSARPSVLIVDDEMTTRTLVRLLLERDGYQVIEAMNGRHALALAAAENVDLVVMDLLMPELDGYGAIFELRRQERHRATPIVVVTTEEGPVVEKQVLELGADDYILKPFEPTVLTSRIKAAFRRQRL
jgi:CheY-like chemotaxis protein